MKQSLLKEIIKKKTSKEEFAIITNLRSGESEIYQPEKELSKEFKVYEHQIQNFFQSLANHSIIRSLKLKLFPPLRKLIK